jgi:hypothetical protein
MINLFETVRKKTSQIESRITKAGPVFLHRTVKTVEVQVKLNVQHYKQVSRNLTLQPT